MHITHIVFIKHIDCMLAPPLGGVGWIVRDVAADSSPSHNLSSQSGASALGTAGVPFAQLIRGGVMIRAESAVKSLAAELYSAVAVVLPDVECVAYIRRT
jgi:hypothetical protein